MHKKYRKGQKKLVFVVLLIISWLLSGYPSISIIKNGSKILRIPPKVKDVRASQATIDSSVHTTVTSHLGTSPTTVFVSQNNGYAFYRDSASTCVYSKTTNGGASWGAAVTVDSNTTCIGIAVWYDRWTPGDTTGSLIHIATIDTTNDDIFYRYLDTSTDTLSTGPVNITSGLSYSGTLASGTNEVALTKGTDGALYAAVADANGTGNILARCASSCTTAGNWTNSSPSSWTAGNDWMILVPMLGADVMLIWWDISQTSNDMLYRVWNGSAWNASFAAIDTATTNTTYDASFGAAIDPSTGDVYFAYAAQANTLGTDDDIRVKKYSYTSGTWSSLTNAVTDSACAGVSNCGITGVKIARDNTNGDLYVLYSAQSTPGTTTTANVYLKVSIDDGSTWSSEAGPLYSSNDDIYGARVSLSNSNAIIRIYATWYAATPDDLFGRPIAPKTFTQSAYRFFTNQDSTDVGSSLTASQDQPATLSTDGQAFRLRILIHVSTSDLLKNEGVFKLQYAGKGSGSCSSPSGTPSSYTDITTTTDIAFYNNSTPSDGSALTNNASDPAHGSDTVRNQTYEEANNFTNSQLAVDSGEDGKWDFSLIDYNAPSNTTYCFRVVKSDNSVLEGYTYPEITVATSTIVSITLTSDGTVNYGTVPLSSTKSTIELSDTQTVQNNGNVNENFFIKSSHAIGGVQWTLSSAIGADSYVHEFSTNGGSNWTKMTDMVFGHQFASSVPPTSSQSFDLRINTPTSTTDYQQKTITITITAVQAL